MKKIYDISKPILKGMAVYKNMPSKQPILESIAKFKDDGFNESQLTMNLHTGTHVDAPFHMIADGQTIDEVDLNLYLGLAKVLDLLHINGAIQKKDLLDFEINAGDIILFHTKNSEEDRFNPDFVYLEEDAATYLVAKGVKTIGIDAMSVERGKEDHPTHRILLHAGVGIIEDLRFAGVPAGSYNLQALPIKICQADGAPVRAILVEI